MNHAGRYTSLTQLWPPYSRHSQIPRSLPVNQMYSKRLGKGFLRWWLLGNRRYIVASVTQPFSLYWFSIMTGNCDTKRDAHTHKRTPLRTNTRKFMLYYALQIKQQTLMVLLPSLVNTRSLRQERPIWLAFSAKAHKQQTCYIECQPRKYQPAIRALCTFTQDALKYLSTFSIKSYDFWLSLISETSRYSHLRTTCLGASLQCHSWRQSHSRESSANIRNLLT